MIRLTRTGAFYLMIMVLFYVASLISQSGLLLVLIGIMAGCYLVNAVTAWQSVKCIGLRPPEKMQVPESQPAREPWEIENRGSGTAGMVSVSDASVDLFRIGRIAARERAHPVPQLRFARRGIYPHHQLRVSSIFPFGLVRAQRRLELRGEIVVVPAVYTTAPPRASGFDSMVGGKLKGQHANAGGANFAGVRPLQPGDSLRQIHWKSSAKGQGLMVKTFEEEMSGRVGILLDAGAWGDPDRLDDAVRAAGSLVFAALDAGHHVEIVTLAGSDHFVVPPFSDGGAVLDWLARLKRFAGSLPREKIKEAVERLSRKAALSFVLTGTSPELFQVLRDFKSRKISLYLPEGAAVSYELMEAGVFRYGLDSIRPE